MSKGINIEHAVCACMLSRVQLFVTSWTVALQAPLLMGFCSKNNGVGCHFLLQGIFLTQGSNLCLLNRQAASLLLGHQGNSSRLWSCLIMTAGRSWNRRTPFKQSSNPLQTDLGWEGRFTMKDTYKYLEQRLCTGNVHRTKLRQGM